MRSWISTICACAVALGLAQAHFTTDLASVIVSGGGSGSTYHVTVDGSGQSQHSSRQGETTTALGPIFVPSLITHTGSSLSVSCVVYRTIQPRSTAIYQAELSWAEAMWARLSSYSRCGASPVSTLTIATIWSQVVNDRLPPPRVRIDPDLGILNVPLKLVTTSTRTADLTVPTNDGPLTITAWASTSWAINDSALPPPPSPGLNQLTWYRPRARGYLRVDIVEHWFGTYQLGGLSGTLPTLSVASPPATVPVIALSTQLSNVL